MYRAFSDLFGNFFFFLVQMKFGKNSIILGGEIAQLVWKKMQFLVKLGTFTF